MEINFVPEKYHGKWAIYCKRSNTFSNIGKGKKYCTERAKELNVELTELLNHETH